MFLNDEILKHGYSFLNEADDDENNEEHPENEKGDEPTESDSDMNNNDDNQDNNSDDNQNDDNGDQDGGSDDDMSMDMDDDGSGDQDSGADTLSSEAGSDDTKSNPLEGMKKKKLLKDYRKLMTMYDDAVNSLSFINYSALSPNEKKIFNYLEKKIKITEDNIDIVVKDEYEIISYVRLLKLYLYFKLQLKTFSDIIKEFIKE